MSEIISNQDILNIGNIDNIEAGSVSFSKDYFNKKMVWYGHLMFRKNNTNANQHFGPCDSEAIVRQQMHEFIALLTNTPKNEGIPTKDLTI